MKICADGHEEICYAGHTCPLCEVIDEIRDLGEEIRALRAEMDEIRAMLEGK